MPQLKHATLPKRPKLNIAPGDYYCAPDKTFEPGPRKGSLGPGAATASIEAVKRVMHPERVALITAAVATPLYSNPNHRRYATGTLSPQHCQSVTTKTTSVGLKAGLICSDLIIQWC